MTIQKLSDNSSYRGHFFEWIEEWPQLRPGYNWRTFHPLMLEFEDDRIMGAVKATVIILGLGVRWRWNYAVTTCAQECFDALRDVEEQIAEAKTSDL